MLNDVFFWWSRKTHRFLLTKYLLGFEVSPANNSFCETAKQNKNCFYEKCWWNYFQHLCSPRVHQPGFNNLLTTRLLKRGNPPFCCRHRSWGWWIFFFISLLKLDTGFPSWLTGQRLCNLWWPRIGCVVVYLQNLIALQPHILVLVLARGSKLNTVSA